MKFKNESKLRNMSKKHPKDYWKFLNSLKTKSSAKYPDIKIFYDYFHIYLLLPFHKVWKQYLQIKV